jgi:hypothetical protein
MTDNEAARVRNTTTKIMALTKMPVRRVNETRARPLGVFAHFG